MSTGPRRARPRTTAFPSRSGSGSVTRFPRRGRPGADHRRERIAASRLLGLAASLVAPTDAAAPAGPAPGRAQRLAAGWGSRWSYASVGSVGSVASFLSVGSALSIGSAGSILSIGSAGSCLSIGSAGSFLSIGSAGSRRTLGRARPRRRTTPDARLRAVATTLAVASVLRAAAPGTGGPDRSGSGQRPA